MKTFNRTDLIQSRCLAGLRCGFAVGSPVLIEGLARIKNSFNSYTMDTIALKLAKAAIEDKEYFLDTVNKVKATRAWVSAELRKLGFRFADSYANFLFVTHPNMEASVLFEQLRRQGILVRYFNLPRIQNHLRITVGTDEEMKQLINKLKEILP